MGKKHKTIASKGSEEATEGTAPEASAKPGKQKRPSPKKRLRQLEARVEDLERRLDDLGRVVDEAIRTSIAARPKAEEVRPRRRKPAADQAA
jgi:hypothetical protein